MAQTPTQTRDDYDYWCSQINLRQEFPNLSDDEYDDLLHETWLSYELKHEQVDDLVDDWSEPSVLSFRFSLWGQLRRLYALVERADEGSPDHARVVRAICHDLISRCLWQENWLYVLDEMSRNEIVETFAQLKEQKLKLTSSLVAIIRADSEQRRDREDEDQV